ncbi:hypothetical protein, partial [Acidithiobacillus ferrooxidans]|uniref:hypothetical protein n=1 Tax=Acidithiobacillus ferrooxidans TaxID=920 RepID=UPI0019434931
PRWAGEEAACLNFSSTNMLLKQAKLVVETAATATKQSQTWGLAAVVSAKISVTIMLFVFIFLGFLLA